MFLSLPDISHFFNILNARVITGINGNIEQVFNFNNCIQTRYLIFHIFYILYKDKYCAGQELFRQSA